jgi:hypothetical protein
MQLHTNLEQARTWLHQGYGVKAVQSLSPVVLLLLWGAAAFPAACGKTSWGYRQGKRPTGQWQIQRGGFVGQGGIVARKHVRLQ